MSVLFAPFMNQPAQKDAIALGEAARVIGNLQHPVKMLKVVNRESLTCSGQEFKFPRAPQIF